MHKVLPVVVLGWAMAFGDALPARAQVMLDVSKLSCWQYVTYKVTSPKYLAVWLSGYDHGRRGDVVIDMQRVVENAAKLEEYCTKNPDVPMMQAAETVLERQN